MAGGGPAPVPLHPEGERPARVPAQDETTQSAHAGRRRQDAHGGRQPARVPANDQYLH